MNIVDPILFQARLQPEAPALGTHGRGIVSYAQLVEQMHNVARRALSFGLKPGSVVALSIEDTLSHAIVLLGLALTGIVTLSVVRGQPKFRVKLDAVISNNISSFVPGIAGLPLDLTWFAGTGKPVETTPSGDAANNEVCRISMTSGTTGGPKAVALTHGLIEARIAQYSRYMSRYSRFFFNWPMAAGTDLLVDFLGRGGTVYFPADNLEDSIRSFEIYSIQSFGAFPGVLVQLLRIYDQFPGFDYQFDNILTGGGTLPKALVERSAPATVQDAVVWLRRHRGGRGGRRARASGRAHARRSRLSDPGRQSPDRR